MRSVILSNGTVRTMVEVILQQWDEVQNDNNNNSSSNSYDDITTHSNIFIDEVGRRMLLYIPPKATYRFGKNGECDNGLRSSIEILIKEQRLFDEISSPVLEFSNNL
jgi:hypothetical protein